MSSLLATTTGAAVSSGAEVALFWVFAAIAIGSAVAVVAMRNIVHGALMLVVNLLSIAALYLGLQSSFLSIVQVIVYAGAIVVLFLFVIMLLGIDRDDLLGTKAPIRSVAAVVGGVALAGALLVVLGDGSLTAASACGAQAGQGAADAVTCIGLDEASGDSVGFVGSRLFTRWTFAFEISALLLVVATLGALVLGRRRDPGLAEQLTATAPMPDEQDLAALRERLVEEQGDGSEELATADVRPSHDATATLDQVDERDRPDTDDDYRPGSTFDVTEPGERSDGEDA